MEKRKVLLVEDERIILDFLKEILLMQGCAVLTAENAQDAWEIFQKEHPQACSLDLHLKHSAYDGIKLLEKIRSVDKQVLCTAFTRIVNEKELNAVKAAGIDRIFPKPPEDDRELEEMIDLLAKGARKTGENHG